MAIDAPLEFRNGEEFHYKNLMHSKVNFAITTPYTGWTKKVSHYKESPLNRINNSQCGYIFH